VFVADLAADPPHAAGFLFGTVVPVVAAAVTPVGKEGTPEW
jgi:hypothetical protein